MPVQLTALEDMYQGEVRLAGDDWRSRTGS
jgi:hypothetical protein